MATEKQIQYLQILISAALDSFSKSYFSPVDKLPLFAVRGIALAGADENLILDKINWDAIRTDMDKFLSGLLTVDLTVEKASKMIDSNLSGLFWEYKVGEKITFQNAEKLGRIILEYAR